MYIRWKKFVTKNVCDSSARLLAHTFPPPKGTYSPSSATNMFRVSHIDDTLIQFYKSRMRSNIKKKIKQIIHANKPNVYVVVYPRQF